MPPAARAFCAVGVAILSCGQAFESEGGVSFITLGDWGGATLGENPEGHTYVKNVHDVASQMAATAKSRDTQFIVNTGDNFYWCGIGNVSDFQVDADFVQPYEDLPNGTDGKPLKWYSVLGNHEYGYNVSAQIDLASYHSNWVMDDRYYSRRVLLPPRKDATDGQHITMIFLDTSPCVTEYRSDDPSGWDPCGSEFPNCALDGGSGTFEGKCRFHEQIVAQDCDRQFSWFKAELAKVPEDDWLVVVGHHTAEDIDVEGTDFVAAMQARPSGVDLYLNGHAHTLTHYAVDGKGAYVTSGAGALVTSSTCVGHAPCASEGATPAWQRTYNKTMGLPVEDAVNGHRYSKVWNGRQSGFTISTFSSDYSKLSTDFIGTDGSVLHSFTVARGGSPSPGPAPSPGPGPAEGSCQVYKCGSYGRGQKCQCNRECVKYADCCSDYESRCRQAAEAADKMYFA